MAKAVEQEEDIESIDSSEAVYEQLKFIVDKGQEPLRIDKFLVALVVLLGAVSAHFGDLDAGVSRLHIGCRTQYVLT